MSLEAVPVIYFGEQRISRLTGTSRNACQSAFMCDADKLGGPEEGRDTGCVLGTETVLLTCRGKLCVCLWSCAAFVLST